MNVFGLVSECTLWLYSPTVLSDCTLWLYSLTVLSYCTIWLYSLTVLSGSTLWLYSLTVLSDCTIWLYSLTVYSLTAMVASYPSTVAHVHCDAVSIRWRPCSHVTVAHGTGNGTSIEIQPGTTFNLLQGGMKLCSYLAEEHNKQCCLNTWSWTINEPLSVEIRCSNHWATQLKP